MLRYSTCAIVLVMLGACASDKAAAPPPSASNRSGIDLQYVDASVRPQDDPYQYLNGKWLRNFQLPPDKALVGSFSTVDDATQDQLRLIVDSLAVSTAGDSDPDARKLADFYASLVAQPS